ncbi:MAG TPA: hypothetical protein VHL78_09440, partial [Actinomycetota bacterium]|nr:hypothetical protein [Actinomycetota bacterium]
MMRRRSRQAAVLGMLAAFLVVPMVPARADHTNPNTPQWLTNGVAPGTGIARGAGTWTFLENFAANPGSDLKFFEKNGDLYSSSGTLGQGVTTAASSAPQPFIGQRILRLIDREVVNGQVTETVDPTWVADHGSAKCDINTAVTGLQHDVAVTPRVDPVLMADTTDATGRCHDTPGGGLELIDISGLGTPGFEVRELRLIHLRGLSHTVTADPNRPGIFYNSASDSNTVNTWIDVINARSCMRFTDANGDGTITLAEKREQCNPQVYRLSWEHRPDWSQRDPDGEELPRPNDPTSAANCHDITVVRSTLYCAGLNATLIFDIRGMFVPGEGLNGRPLECTERPGTRTAAMVTDCSAIGPNTPTTPVRHLRGWRFRGNYNHPGRPANQANNNLEVPSEEGVSVSHESDPSPDNKSLFVTDERGGGVVPPGASCSPGIDNPYGNGGIHVYDLTKRVRDLNGGPPYFPYAKEVGDDKAVWRGSPTVPAATFCTVHVIHHIPDERRIFMGYYSQGVKVLDYSVDDQGRFTFTETASFTLAGVNSWVTEPFKIVDNPDGTRTYFLMSSDIQRGIDFLTWTGPTNPIGRP